MMEKIKLYVVVMIFMATLALAGYFDGEVALGAERVEVGNVFDSATLDVAENFWGYDAQILPHSTVVVLFDNRNTPEIEDDIILGVFPIR